MTPDQIQEQLQSKINSGLDLTTALRIFVEHYKATTVEACMEDDGDTLLYQWGGPYAWDDSFTINLTRQFMLMDNQGEYDCMKKLRMDCKYSPNEIQIEGGNFWCDKESTEQFLEKIYKSKGYINTKGLGFKSIEFILQDV